MKTNKIIKILLVLILTLVLFGCGPEEKENPDITTPYTDQLKLTSTFDGKSFINDGIGVVTVEQYIDGDTAIFKDSITKETFTLRFNGIDTPESTYRVDPWGFAAAKFTKEKLSKATKIVLETDSNLTSRLDSTGKRYLGWVWYLTEGSTDYRLLCLEIIENSYSVGKGAGTSYVETITQADLSAQKNKIRVHNLNDKDPDYDYNETGVYYSLKQLRQYSQTDINNEKDKGKKIRVQGIISIVSGTGSAYIQQQDDGNWFIGSTDTGIVALSSSADIAYIGSNGNWFIGSTDLGVAAVDGTPGQTAYQYYVNKTSEPHLTESEWYQAITVGEVDLTINTPYIVKDLTWYGMYLYGGYTSNNKLVSGREIYVEGTLGYYNGSMQVTGVSASTTGIISSERVDPFVLSVDSTKFNTLNNSLLGCLIQLENLKVVDGYDTATSDGYTIYCETSNGIRISIRIDTTVSIKKNAQGEFDPSGTIIVKSWKDFEGLTFTSITAIFGVYNGTYQLQLMGTRYFDVKPSK